MGWEAFGGNARSPPFDQCAEASRRRPKTGRFTYAFFGLVMREWMMLVSNATPPKTVSAM